MPKPRPTRFVVVLNAVNEGLVEFGFPDISNAFAFWVVLKNMGHICWVDHVSERTPT